MANKKKKNSLTGHYDRHYKTNLNDNNNGATKLENHQKGDQNKM